jgi:hypothetical protein
MPSDCVPERLPASNFVRSEILNGLRFDPVRHDCERTTPDIVVDASDIFPDDADKQRLYAHGDEHEQYERGESEHLSPGANRVRDQIGKRKDRCD